MSYLPGWYEVRAASTGEKLPHVHLVHDGGFGKLSAGCGVRASAVYLEGSVATPNAYCSICSEIQRDEKLLGSTPFTAEELAGGPVPDSILQRAFKIPPIPPGMILRPQDYCCRCRTLLDTDAAKECLPFKGANGHPVCRNRNGDRTRIFVCPPKI